MTTTNSRHAGNLIFSYSKQGVRQSYRCYGTMLNYDMAAVSEESAARRYRAFYPHSFAVGPFAVTVINNGYREYRAFNEWMTAYVGYLLDPQDFDQQPVMAVAAVGKDFWRLGIPKSGMEFGNRLGRIAYSQTISFEAANDPLEKGTVVASKFVDATNRADFNVGWFYPSSEYITSEGTLTLKQAAEVPYDQTYVIPPDQPPASTAPPMPPLGEAPHGADGSGAPLPPPPALPGPGSGPAPAPSGGFIPPIVTGVLGDVAHDVLGSVAHHVLGGLL